MMTLASSISDVVTYDAATYDTVTCDAVTYDAVTYDAVTYNARVVIYDLNKLIIQATGSLLMISGCTTGTPKQSIIRITVMLSKLWWVPYAEQCYFDYCNAKCHYPEYRHA